MGGVPKVTVLHVVEADEDGNIWAKPEHWESETPPPRLRVIERDRRGALGIGDRVLARTEERGKGYVAHPLKKLARKAELVLGVLRKEGTHFWLTPVEKKERRELPVSDVKDGESGDLVLCEVSGRGPRVIAKVDAVLGDPFAPKSFSLIAIHKYELPHDVARHPEIFDRVREREAVGRDDADVRLAVDETVLREVLGVDGCRIHIGENLEVIGDSGVVAIGGEAVADAPLAPLRLDERLDHCVLLSLLANPAVGKNGHKRRLTGGGSRFNERCPISSLSTCSRR